MTWGCAVGVRSVMGATGVMGVCYPAPSKSGISAAGMATRTDRGTPGSRTTSPSSSSLTIMPWTDGGETRKKSDHVHLRRPLAVERAIQVNVGQELPVP